MKTLLLYGKKDIRLENRPIPKIKDNEILIRIKACGICKSDIDYYFDGRVSDFVVDKPIVIGHESSGVIEATGEKVTGIKMGDRVSIIPSINCGRCSFCLDKSENLCRNRNFVGTPAGGFFQKNTQGCFQEYIAHPARCVAKIDKTVSFEEAAIIEPASVAYNAIKLAGGIGGENRIGIIGAGTIGLLLGTLFNLNRNNKIYYLDIDRTKIDFALGSIKNSSGYIVNDNDRNLPRNLNMCFDVSGSSTGVNTAIKMMDFRGKIILIGLTLSERSMDCNTVVVKELMLKGSSGFTILTYKEVTKLLNSRRVDFKNLYKSGFGLEEVEKVLIKLKNKGYDKPKVVINI